MTEERDRRTHLTNRLGIAAAVLILALWGVLLLIGTLDGNSTQARIETDRIAACSASEDVVGCLEAVMP